MELAKLISAVTNVRRWTLPWVRSSQ